MAISLISCLFIRLRKVWHVMSLLSICIFSSWFRILCLWGSSEWELDARDLQILSVAQKEFKDKDGLIFLNDSKFGEHLSTCSFYKWLFIRLPYFFLAVSVVSTWYQVFWYLAIVGPLCERVHHNTFVLFLPLQCDWVNWQWRVSHSRNTHQWYGPTLLCIAANNCWLVFATDIANYWSLFFSLLCHLDVLDRKVFLGIWDVE